MKYCIIDIWNVKLPHTSYFRSYSLFPQFNEIYKMVNNFRVFIVICIQIIITINFLLEFPGHFLGTFS